MSALAVVETQIRIEIDLELINAGVELPAKRQGEGLFLDGAMESFAEAVRLRRADFGAPVLDLGDCQVQLERMMQLPGRSTPARYR